MKQAPMKIQTTKKIHKNNQNLLQPGLVVAALLSFLLTCYLLFLPSTSEANQQTNLLTNQLANHPSKYLAAHADDPILWQNFTPKTLQIAKQTNRPILVSSGYFACHWCFVMQQENYKNQQIAALINQNFIPIKLDRELNPDLDTELLEFARKTSGRAGWPLHVVLTPDFKPLTSFVYQPTEQLQKTLETLVDWWANHEAHLRKLADENQTSEQKVLALTDFNQQAIIELLAQIDSFNGGIDASQKFPHSPLLLSLLLQPGLAASKPELAEWLELTLEQIQNEHLHDHVFGGFFRYTIDPNWQIPHFEKMLYDNAQLAEIFLLAADKFQRQDFAKTAAKTIEYLQTQISPTTHLAYSSQSALDENGTDGGRYLWNKLQLQQTLSKQEFSLLNQAWLLEQTPPIEDSWLPKPFAQTNEKTSWQTIKPKLQNRKAVIDNKQLISWNGLVLKAFASNYQQNATDANFQISNQLAEQLIKILSSKNPPKAINDANQQLGTADYQDFAYVIAGLKAWQTASGKDFSTQIKQLSTKAKLLSPPTRPGYNLPNAKALLNCQPESIKISGANDPLWLYLEFLNPCND